MNRPFKILEVSESEFRADYPGLDDISERLDSLHSYNAVDFLNWKDFDYKPDVKFAMAYTRHEILLKYYVTEHWFKAEMTETNQEVYEDSCVEFFIAPSDDGIYYNFELNAIGTCLMASGTERGNRSRIAPGIISAIRRFGSSGVKSISEKSGEFSWTLTLAIPLTVFIHHDIKELKGRIFRANFYKCGDKLTVPHYLSWNPVGAEKPDFHRPEYFGLLKFV
jgi:Carbohydrate-binding family 9